ncbi:DUF2919 domain-containing protein [Motilimonas cestriensis]|uniref:DUF2919 domain-containing protein n=1 Tax=Motilimonas cestriensis TaxID=2742685 RepID=A0ABS8W6Z8_9GAMM|nr:DUF2919 domain-containing protein [Motilimonas cestriensis]MCE2593306.1 DUF2919 domain-containing protein [Motilimonas cestriensis]
MRHLYPISQYDNNGDLKPPIWFYASLFFLARTWVIWIMSATIRPDGSKIMALFYPIKVHFFMGMASGALAVVLFLIASRKENKWIAPLWHKGRALLLFAVLIDFGLLLNAIVDQHFSYSWASALQLVLVSWILLYTLKSQRLADCFNNYQIGKKTANKKIPA